MFSNTHFSRAFKTLLENIKIFSACEERARATKTMCTLLFNVCLCGRIQETECSTYETSTENIHLLLKYFVCQQSSYFGTGNMGKYNGIIIIIISCTFVCILKTIVSFFNHLTNHLINRQKYNKNFKHICVLE